MYVIFDTLNAGKLIGLHVTFLNPFDALGWNKTNMFFLKLFL